MIRPGRPAVVDPVSPDRVDLAADAMEASGPIEGERCPPGKPRVLFVAIVNNVGCERVVVDMAQHGALCALISPPDFYAASVIGLTRHIPLPSFSSVWLTSLFVRRRLEQVVRDWSPELIVPLDDIAAWLLRSLVATRQLSAGAREILVRSLGAPHGYRTATSRHLLMELAARLGLRKPHHAAVTGAFADEDPSDDDWSFPLFLKTEHTCGGFGVEVVQDRSQFAQRVAAQRRGGSGIRRLASTAKHALQRAAGFDLWASADMIAQTHAVGRPAFRTVSTWQGRVLAGVSFVAEQIHPEPTGASTVIRHVENQEMAETAAALTEALGCSGFVSFDFMLNTEDETATLIEMNPRCVGSCHLGQLFGQDLAGALMSEVSGRQHTLSAESADERLIALFPKELDRDPKSFYLSSSAVRHDVPSAEPALVAAHERDLVARHPADARLIRRHISQGPVDRPSPEAQRGHYTSASHLTGEFVCNASGSSGRDR